MEHPTTDRKKGRQNIHILTIYSGDDQALYPLKANYNHLFGCVPEFLVFT